AEGHVRVTLTSSSTDADLKRALRPLEGKRRRHYIPTKCRATCAVCPPPLITRNQIAKRAARVELQSVAGDVRGPKVSFSAQDPNGNRPGSCLRGPRDDTESPVRPG